MNKNIIAGTRPHSVAAFCFCLGLAIVAMASLPNAFAQAPLPDTKTSGKVEGKLETITVTAERREENIKDVPISISTLAGEKLEVIASGGQDVRMLAARVPSLNIESSFGRAFPRFYIRGYGNTDFDLNASQPVSLVYDDIVQENPLLKGFPVFDLAQIEVLRGPQGTAFGRNTPAGVVKFDSVKPSRQQDAYVSLSTGTYQTTNLEGAFNIPLGDAWAARVSLLSQTRDDWVKNSAQPRQKDALEGYTDRAARVQLLFAPNNAFSALFNFHTRDLNGTARLFRANIIKSGTNDLVDGFDPARISIDGHNSQDAKINGGSIKFRWALDGVTLHSITGIEKVTSFSRGDIDGGFGAFFLPKSGPGFIPFAAESADGLPRHRQLTQEFRLESNANGPLKWLAGLYFFDEDVSIDSFNYDTLSAGVQNGVAKQQQRNKTQALFGSVNYKVSDALTFRGGLRFTQDKKDFIADRLVAPPFSPAFIGRLTKNTDVSNTSGDFSGTFQLDKDTNVYARVARGFRAPSIQGRLLFDDTLSVARTETVTSYEAGIKSDLWDRRARLGFNVFHFDVKDLQLSAVGGNANSNRLVNAAKASGQGLEMDLEAYVTETLLLTVGASLNDTRIKDRGLLIAGCAACTILNPIIVPANPAIGKFSPTVSIDGNVLPQAPKYVASMTLKYILPLGGGSEFTLYSDLAYRSKISFFLYDSKEFIGKALTEVGLRAAYSWGYGKYEVAAYGRNIGNQIRVVGGIDFNNLTGFINEPRLVGAQFRAKF